MMMQSVDSGRRDGSKFCDDAKGRGVARELVTGAPARKGLEGSRAMSLGTDDGSVVIEGRPRMRERLESSSAMSCGIGEGAVIGVGTVGSCGDRTDRAVKSADRLEGKAATAHRKKKELKRLRWQAQQDGRSHE